LVRKPGRVNDRAEGNGADELDNANDDDDEEGVGSLESSFLTQSQFDGSSLASLTASLGPDKLQKPKAKQGGAVKHPNAFL
jgi:hypothetical protein